MRFSTFLLSTVMLSAAFAGCSGEAGPASADFAATPLNADKSSYKFDAGNSSGDGLTYAWDFGDQSAPGTGPVVEHTYQYPNGQYTVTLKVTGTDGTTSEKTQKVQVGTGQNTEPVLYLKTDKRWVAPDETVTFDATQSYDPDGDPIFFKWDFNSPLSTDDFNDMENLGQQQYGIYKNGAPTGSGTNSTGDGGEGGGLLLTPSGYNWAKEYQKAQQQLIDRLGVSTFDGDHSVKPEPRNEGYDGTTTDTGPIQLWQFPAAATYFVHVQVLDIKGDAYHGFIRINVDPNVPESTFTLEDDGDLAASPFGALGDAAPTPETQNTKYHEFSAAYPAQFDITVTYTGTAPDPAPTNLGGYVCAATLPGPDCVSRGSQKTPWESGATLRFDMGASLVGAFKVMLRTEGDPTTGEVSGPASYTISINGTIFPNKWYAEEAGLHTGH